MNTDYTAGRHSVADVIHDCDLLRRVAHRRPICVFGQSAGGQLALMVAAARPTACTIAEAAPTDLTRLRGFSAPNFAVTGTQVDGPDAVADMAVAAFGATLEANSPAYLKPHGRVLLGLAANDVLIPQDQVAEHKRNWPGAQAITLPPGDEQFFVHGTTSKRGRAMWDAAMANLLTDVVGPHDDRRAVSRLVEHWRSLLD